MNCDMYGLIKKLPPEFKLILDYIKTLDYYQMPNYKVSDFVINKVGYFGDGSQISANQKLGNSAF